MYISELLILGLIAVAITLVFSFGFKNRGPWGNIWVFFALIFLGIWAASRWIEPFGPVYMGVAWIPILLFGFLIALLLSAAVPIKSYRQKQREADAPAEPPSEDSTRLQAFGIFFWLLVITLGLAITFGYLIES
jgi:hypothetical protein